MTTAALSSNTVQTGSMNGAGAATGTAAVQLLSSSTSVAGPVTQIDMVFSTGMARGAGHVYITDGAVQTVIDRVSGQPTMRIVGATETRKIPVGELEVSGNHVIIKAEGLAAGHSYSVYMGEGVLLSSTLRSFAGVTVPGTVGFSVQDGTGPALVSMELSAAVVAPGAGEELTLRFSEPVSVLPAGALQAPGATIGAPRAVGDGTVWKVSVTTAGALPSANNKISLDMSQVGDAAGNKGSGSFLSSAYVVDNGQPPTATIGLPDTQLVMGETGEVTIRFSEPVSGLTLDAITAPHVSLSSPVTSDNGLTWKLTMTPNAPNLNAAGLQLNVDLSKVADLAGHAGIGSAISAPYAVDTGGPAMKSMALSTMVLDPGHEAVLTITFSEPVAVLPAAALQAPGAAIGALHAVGDGTVWEVKLSASTGGLPSTGNKITLDMAQVRDAAGNKGGAPVFSPAYAIDDGNPPTATITMPDRYLTAGEAGQVTIVFSEAVTGLSLGALSAPYVNLSVPVSGDGGLTWKLTMAPVAADLNVSGLQLVLDLSKVSDSAGRAGLGSVASAYAVNTSSVADSEGPGIESITFDGATLDADHDLVATIRFSEAVQEAGLLDALYAGSAELSGLASADGGKTWTVTLSLSDAGEEAGIGVFGVNLAEVRDLAGNNGAGFEPMPAYVINTSSSFMFIEDEGYDPTDGLISDNNQRYVGGILFGEYPDPELSFELTIGGVAIDNVEISFIPLAGGLVWYYSGEEYWSAGSYDIIAKATNAGGDVLAMNKQVIVDGSAPEVVESPAAGDLPPPFDVTDALVIQFNEAVYFDDEAPRIRVDTRIGDAYPVTTYIAVSDLNLSTDRKTLTIAADKHQLMTEAYVTLFLHDIADLAGNSLSAEGLSFTTIGPDTAAPVAVDLHALGYSAGPLTTGDSVRFTIAFNESVTLFGDQERYVTMNNGGRAYLEGADMNWTELSFRYTVQEGDEDISYLDVADLGGLVNQLKDAQNNVLSDAYVDFGGLYLAGYGSFEVDQTAPSTLPQAALAAGSDTGTAGDGITRFNAPTIQGEGAEPYAKVHLELDGQGAGYVRADMVGNWSWTPSADLAAGGHALRFWQEDQVGLVGGKSTLNLSIEALGAPQLDAASDSGASSSDGITRDATPTYAGSGAVGGRTIKLFAGATEIGRTTALADGTWSITVAEGDKLADGVYTITAREYEDSTGAQTDLSAGSTLVIDTAAPVVTGETENGLARTYALSFSEKVVFAAGGRVDVFQNADLRAYFTAGGANWSQPQDNEMSFSMSYNGLFKMQLSTEAIQDVAGNVALIGEPYLEFNLPPSY